MINVFEQSDQQRRNQDMATALRGGPTNGGTQTQRPTGGFGQPSTAMPSGPSSATRFLNGYNKAAGNDSGNGLADLGKAFGNSSYGQELKKQGTDYFKDLFGIGASQGSSGLAANPELMKMGLTDTGAGAGVGGFDPWSLAATAGLKTFAPDLMNGEFNASTIPDLFVGHNGDNSTKTLMDIGKGFFGGGDLWGDMKLWG